MTIQSTLAQFRTLNIHGLNQQFESLSLARLMPQRIGPSMGGIQIAVSISETHTKTADVTQDPVEGGLEVSDNRTRKPDVVKLEGIVLPELGDPPDATTGGSPTIRKAYADLEKLHDKNIPFKLVTGLKMYPVMVMEEFSVTRNKDTANIIAFSAKMVEIKIVASQTALVPKVPPKRGAKTNLGTKPAGGGAVPPPAAEKQRGLLLQLTGPAPATITNQAINNRFKAAALLPQLPTVPVSPP